MDFRSNIIAAVRTAVAGFIAWLILTLAARGIAVDVDQGTIDAVALFAAAIVAGVYNFVVNALASRWPVFGILLGIPTQPQYAPASVTDNKVIVGEVITQDGSKD